MADFYAGIPPDRYGGAYIRMGPIRCGNALFVEATDWIVLPDGDGWGVEVLDDWTGDGIPDLLLGNADQGEGWISVTPLPL